MVRYITRRVLIAIPMLLLITLILFYAIFAVGDPVARLTAGNPRITEQDIARIKQNFGLDKPRPLQYLVWLGNVVRGDFGESIVSREPVSSMIGRRLGNTLILMGTAFVVTQLIAIPIALVSALRQYSWFDYLVTGLSFVFYSFPVFFLGFMLLWIFSVKFNQWGLPSLPSGKMYDVRGERNLFELVKHLVLPVLTLALLSAAGYVRYLRASVLEVLGQDYIRTARAKGLWNALVIRRHVLKNAALPVVTIMILELASLFSGAIVTESIFAWPGMGSLFIDAMGDIDYPVLMGVLFIATSLVIIFNLIADIVYAYLDPRISYS